MIFEIKDDGEMAQLIRLLPEAITAFKTAAEIMQNNALTARYYDLETCHKLRGAGSFSTFRNHRWYQPKGGKPDAIVQGRHVWTKETVAEWLTFTDQTLPDYHKKYCTGAKNPHGEKGGRN